MKQSVTIERMGYGAQAVGRLDDGKTVFVEGGAPQERVTVEIFEEKNSFAKGRILSIDEASPVRVKLLYPELEQCGVSPWAHIAYDAQLSAKRGNVIAHLMRTAHFDQDRAESLVSSCLASKREWGYRNKLELGAQYSTQGTFELGFYKEGSHELVPLDSCSLAHKAIEKSPRALQGALRFAQGSQNLGIFRIGVRCSVRTRDVEIALWTTPGAFPRAHVANMLKSTLKATSIVRVLADRGKARKIKGVETLDGKGCWEEELLGSRYFTSAPSFFQVNTAQAERLVEVALEGLGGPSGLNGAYVADLYAGGGTFSVQLACAGAEVVAVEAAGSSVRDLRRNAEMNGVDIEVVGGDAARELPELGDLDGLIVDPPRSGLAEGVVESIARAHPDKVAYVSCDPATWARDVARFEAQGYKLTRVQPVDLFPQTYHVEVVSIFNRL